MTPPNPVSLVNLTGKDLELEPLLESVCRTILDRLEAYEDAPVPETLTAEYRSRLWRGQGFHLWKDAATGQNYEAEIADVAVNGILTLRDRQNQDHAYAFKEVSAVL